LWIAAAVGVLAVLVVVSIRRGGEAAGARIDAAEVELGDISRIVKASGQIDPRVKVNISTHVVGRIEKLYVEEGDWIEAGEPFLELEQQAFIAARDDWQARLSQARTEVRQAEVDLADTEVKLRRARRLVEEGILSTERLEEAELAHTSAGLRLEQARETVTQTRANLDKALDDLRKTTIYAPLSGRVIELNAEEGEVVVSGTMNNPASVIGTIADLSEILAEVDVDENEIVYVQPGQQTQLEVDAVPDHPYSGRVVDVGNSGYTLRNQPDVTFFKVKVLLEKPDEELRSGMSVRADITTATHRQVALVPIQAVVQRPPKIEPDPEAAPEEGSEPEVAAVAGGAPAEDEEVAVVFVVDGETASQREVETGISNTTEVEIVHGVEPGQQVVVGPYRELRDLEDGDAVTIAEPEKEETRRDRG
jgi:HlyD family secretion protein